MDLKYYWHLLAQRERIEAFRAAIEKTVTPDDVVLDIGTGLGTFAFFAAQAGARRVYAVDADPVIHVAQAIARDNGLDDRVTFVRGRYPEVDLPEPASVVMFEDFANRGIDARLRYLVRAARRQHLQEGARWVPAVIRRFVAPCGGPGLAGALDPLGPDDRAYGLQWRAIRTWIDQEPSSPPERVQVLGPPALLDRIATREPPAAWAVGGHATLTIEQEADVRGLLLWSEFELASGITLSNGPGASGASWGRVLLPVAPAVPVAAGDRMKVSVGQDARTDWLSWRLEAEGAVRTGHELAGRPAGRQDLLAGSGDAHPARTERGNLVRTLLDGADGSRPLAEVASSLRNAYPWLEQEDAVGLAASLLDGLVDWRAPDDRR